jgi:biopolymer transport protein ExbB/TolQ
MTTATGLVIAIPAMLFYFYFKSNFAETMSILGQYIGKLSNALETGSVSGNVATIKNTEV